MQYLLQIYFNDAAEAIENLSPEEWQAIAGEFAAITATPGVTAGLRLAPPSSATTVTVRDGATLTTDGPFPDTKEALGGYFLFEADDLDSAISMAARVPQARMGGAVEVRPIVQG
jgi:hypothetical protein